MKGLRRRLAEWLYPTDMAALTRRNLGGVKVDAPYLEFLKEEYDDFLKKAHEIWVNPVLKSVREHLSEAQVDYIVKEAQDVRQMDFARASLNGICLVWEEMERLNSLFEGLSRKEDEYDRTEIM